MKKQLFVPIAVVLLLSACKPKTTTPTPTPAPADTTPPVITMNGANNDTVSLNAIYVDPGATANDNVDGNITASIVKSGNVNMNLVGNYQRFYNVKDAAGNSAAQMTRNVHVRNDADYLVGVYSAVPNCGMSPTSNFTTTLTTSQSVNNYISFNVNPNYGGAATTATVAGSNLVLTPVNSGGSTFSGAAVISTNKKSFTLNYVTGNSTMGSWTCSTVYTKP